MTVPKARWRLGRGVPGDDYAAGFAAGYEDCWSWYPGYRHRVNPAGVRPVSAFGRGWCDGWATAQHEAGQHAGELSVPPAVRPVGTVDDPKDPEGLEDYQPEAEAAESGRPSQGPSSGDAGTRGRFIAVDTAERFWSKVAAQPGPDGCWWWTEALDRDGYGRFRVTDRPGRYRHVQAHRWAYQHTRGPISAGLTVDHRCHTHDRHCPGGRTCAHRRCVRPDHLELVTAEENRRRAYSRPRPKETSVTPHPNHPPAGDQVPTGPDTDSPAPKTVWRVDEAAAKALMVIGRAKSPELERRLREVLAKRSHQLVIFDPKNHADFDLAEHVLAIPDDEEPVR